MRICDFSIFDLLFGPLHSSPTGPEGTKATKTNSNKDVGPRVGPPGRITPHTDCVDDV